MFVSAAILVMVVLAACGQSSSTPTLKASVAPTSVAAATGTHGDTTRSPAAASGAPAASAIPAVTPAPAASASGLPASTTGPLASPGQSSLPAASAPAASAPAVSTPDSTAAPVESTSPASPAVTP